MYFGSCGTLFSTPIVSIMKYSKCQQSEKHGVIRLLYKTIQWTKHKFCNAFLHILDYFHSNEHNGARQTLSLGVCFARGAAEVISFTFSILLITMCYNMVRYMRETVLNLYIPFDKNIVFHKIVAWTAVAFTGESNLSIRSILKLCLSRVDIYLFTILINMLKHPC